MKIDLRHDKDRSPLAIRTALYNLSTSYILQHQKLKHTSFRVGVSIEEVAAECLTGLKIGKICSYIEFDENTDLSSFLET